MEPIVFYDRYRQELCEEKIYGEASLRWTYETRLGSVALHTLVKRAAFSRWYGRKMDRRNTRNLIPPFIERYELDPSEFERQPDQFANFNEFFFRKLKPEARPIDASADTAVFPADGRHLCIPNLDASNGLFVKGKIFNLDTLVDDPDLAKLYHGGSLLLSRLCPVDYHRFHFPVAGRVGESRLVGGHLFSVNPIALKQNIEILATNKRSMAMVESSIFGNVLTMEIGATCVGGIVQTYESDSDIEKGDEKGYFRFGGSSTITLFPPNRIRFDEDLVEQSAQNRELYAKIGDRMGVAR